MFIFYFINLLLVLNFSLILNTKRLDGLISRDILNKMIDIIPLLTALLSTFFLDTKLAFTFLNTFDFQIENSSFIILSLTFFLSRVSFDESFSETCKFSLLLLYLSIFVTGSSYLFLFYTLTIFLFGNYVLKENKIFKLGLFVILISCWIMFYSGFQYDSGYREIFLATLALKLFLLLSYSDEICPRYYYGPFLIPCIFYLYKANNFSSVELHPFIFVIAFLFSLLASFRLYILKKIFRVDANPLVVFVLFNLWVGILFSGMKEILICSLIVLAVVDQHASYFYDGEQKSLNYIIKVIACGVFLLILPYSPTTYMLKHYNLDILVMFINFFIGYYIVGELLKIDFSRKLNFYKSYSMLTPLIFSLVFFVIHFYLLRGYASIEFTLNNYLVAISAILTGASGSYFVRTNQDLLDLENLFIYSFSGLRSLKPLAIFNVISTFIGRLALINFSLFLLFPKLLGVEHPLKTIVNMANTNIAYGVRSKELVFVLISLLFLLTIALFMLSFNWQ